MANSEAKFSISRGSSKTLPAEKDGQLLFTNDSEKLIIDYEGSDGSTKRATINPNPDWDATSGNSQILNKPTIPPAVSVKGSAEETYRTGEVEITPSNLGLGNVDNTKDVDKVVASAGKLTTPRTISISGAVKGSATEFDGSENIAINTTEVDATKVVGVLPMSSIPKGAQDQLYHVDNYDAMLKLTKDEVQNGDVVKCEDTEKYYFVIDDSVIETDDAENAFEPLKIGEAASVAWTNVYNRPTFVNSIKGDAEEGAGRTGDVVITKANIGLDKVNNTPDSEKAVASADKLTSERAIAISGDILGSANFDGSKGITIEAAMKEISGVAGSYGPEDEDILESEGTFSVPYITIDSNGRVTKAETVTLTLPEDKNIVYSVMVGASEEADGASGLVPQPKLGEHGKFLRGDGTWGTPVGTTYSEFSGSTPGLVPASEGGTTKYLRADGKWGSIDLAILTSVENRTLKFDARLTPTVSIEDKVLNFGG